MDRTIRPKCLNLMPDLILFCFVVVFVVVVCLFVGWLVFGVFFVLLLFFCLFVVVFLLSDLLSTQTFCFLVFATFSEGQQHSH